MEMTLTIIAITITVFEAAAITFLFINQRKFQKEREELAKASKKGDVSNLLLEIMKEQKLQKEESTKITKKLEEFKKTAQTHISKIGFKRYNPFETSGGDQSFTIALLNSNNDGLIITSLHQRDINRVYSKLIKNKEPSHKLSKEETEVLNKVLKGVS